MNYEAAIKQTELKIKRLKEKLFHLKQASLLSAMEKDLRTIKHLRYERNSDGTYTFFTHGVFRRENLRVVSEMEKDMFLANKQTLLEECKRYYNTKRF